MAIVGGGESALSALVFLRAMRPGAKITVYTPMLPLSRGESFLENRVFADPDDVGWEHLDLEMRQDFVKHCDRGVFDATVIARLAGEQGCDFKIGRAVHVSAAGEGVDLEVETAAGPTRTAELITTVPVRALTMTRAGGSAVETSRFSISLINAARTSAPCGARTWTDTPSVASAVPAPKRRLIAPATFCALVKSACSRLKVRLGVVA